MDQLVEFEICIIIKLNILISLSIQVLFELLGFANEHGLFPKSRWQKDFPATLPERRELLIVDILTRCKKSSEIFNIEL